MAGIYVLALVLSALYMLVWIPSAFLGRLGERGGVMLRLLPWLAMVSTVVVAGIVLVGLSAAGLSELGRPSPIAWALYGATLAVPVLGAAATLRTVMGAPDANLFARGMAWLSSIATLTFAGYLFAYGWIGMKIWE
jgi:hypothetical protein